MQPSLIIMLAGVITLLLCALIAGTWRYLRRNRIHQHELGAMIGLARHTGQSQSSSVPAAPPESAYEEFVERTGRSIGDLHEAIARLDVKLGQAHHQDVLRDEELDRKIGQEDSLILALQKELHDLGTRHANLEQNLHLLRAEIERLAARDSTVQAKTEARAPISSTAPASMHSLDATDKDDFTLPASVLNELDDVMKSAAAQQPPAVRSQTARMKAKVPRRVSATPKAIAAPVTMNTARSAAVLTQAVAHPEKSSVEEPQFAFDPARIDDLFTTPSFIPGAANTGINVEELDYEDMSLDGPHGETDGSHEQPHYDADRVFYQSSPQTGIKAGWYFSLRGGKTHGPFGNKEAGERVLKEMIDHFKRIGDSGGR
ncbi:MAG: hypothetical protein IPM20_12030 [Gammaproteobacteria bacterium]|nr:hypothetical protein [Gammaproteobacteria bacterium]